METRQNTAKRVRAESDSSLVDSQLLISDSASATRLWQWLDKKLTKQNEHITTQISQIYTHLREGEKRITENIRSTIKETENRLLNEMDKRFCEIREEMNDITERVSKLETVVDEIEILKNQIKDLKIQSIKHSNSLVACDLRINGIPFNIDENLHNMFDSICKTIKIPTPPIQSIHRLQNKNNKNEENSPDGVIIAKFTTPFDKNFFLKSLNIYKKVNKVNLKLNIIGFDSNNDFYIHENLTNGNYKIYREAVKLKKQNTLQSAYIFRGLVYIKRLSTDNPICIENLDVLNQLFLSNGHNNNSTQSNTGENHSDI